MTDHKAEATYHGGEPDPAQTEHWASGGALPQRTPLETFAQHGAPPPVNPGRNSETAPGIPPWGSLSQDIGHPAPRDRVRAANPVAWIWLGLAIVIALTVTLVVLNRTNVVPAGVPLIGKDSGLAACEAIQHGSAPVGGKTTVSPGDFAQARAAFAGSRYPDIRANGVKLMDLAVQMSALGSDPGIGALAYIGAFTDAYAGLAGGCAAVGHPIPPLNAN